MSTTPLPPAGDRQTVDLTDTPSAPPAPPPPPTRPPAPVPDAHRRSAFVIGALLVLGGLTWLAAELDVVDVGWRSIVAGLLVLIGAATVTLALTGHRTTGLVTVGSIVTVVLALTMTVGAPVLVGGVGDRVEDPTSTAELSSPYELAVGTMTVDLTDVDLPDGSTSVEARVGMGELRVRVPEDVSLIMTADVAMGEIHLLNRTETGLNVHDELTTELAGATSTLVLDLSVTTGTIEVTR